jgi:hypothetical protein
MYDFRVMGGGVMGCLMLTAWRSPNQQGQWMQNSTGNETGVSLNGGVNIALKNLYKNTFSKIFCRGDWESGWRITLEIHESLT